MVIPGFNDRTPRDVVWQAMKEFVDDDMLTYAAALSYQILLAFFPFVIFLLTLLGAVGLAPFFDQVLEQARVALPSDAFRLLAGVITEIRGQSRDGLLSVSIVVALWVASAGLRSVTNALNVAHGVKETRPAWQRWPLSVVYTVVLAGLVLAASGLLLLGPRATGWLANRAGIADPGFFWFWLRWPVVIGLLLASFAIIYKVAPNIDRPFRFVTPGSVVGVGCWILASAGFSAYVARFGNYGATYGSLGGIIVALLYFFVSAAALLFGAEINAAIHPISDPEVHGPTQNGDDQPRRCPTSRPGNITKHEPSSRVI